MVTITKLEFKNDYHIIWLRYISGVDLTQHCMNGLKGKNDKRVKGHKLSYETMDLPEAKYYYLCGVKTYNMNVHIAFRHLEGSKISIDNEFVSCEIDNAELYPINKDAINWKLPQANEELFNTCRNWWFANQISNDFVK